MQVIPGGSGVACLHGDFLGGVHGGTTAKADNQVRTEIFRRTGAGADNIGGGVGDDAVKAGSLQSGPGQVVSDTGVEGGAGGV